MHVVRRVGQSLAPKAQMTDTVMTGARIGAAPLSVATPALAPAPLVLKKRADFLAASRAKRGATDGFMWQARRTGSNDLRVGFTCSKKVGNAVARNRAKRRLREVARVVLPEHGRPGWDYVLIGRSGRTDSTDFLKMCEDLKAALHKLHVPQS